MSLFGRSGLIGFDQEAHVTISSEPPSWSPCNLSSLPPSSIVVINTFGHFVDSGSIAVKFQATLPPSSTQDCRWCKSLVDVHICNLSGHRYSSFNSDFSLNGPGTGALGGPPTQHNYKRAVCRAPPSLFAVEVLPPTKFGSGYCYGMRICPIQNEISDDRSNTSGGSLTEYDVWRRWEDCLWFQEILESEYALMARTKRHRLAAGKGVKKNGVYIHSDQAASFESLPPGPDANTIAKDIHNIVPRLTKKGTLFRASQATIEQRGKEFRAMIDALFQEDVPMLIKELRDTRLVRDFFGYWRRDQDHYRKRVRPPSNGGNVRNSVASSVFSMYFSASNISLQLPNAFSDLPPSPSLPSFPPSPQRQSPKRESKGKTPLVSFPPIPPTAPAGLTFSLSDRGSLALQSPTSDDDARSEYFGCPLSAPPTLNSLRWSRTSAKPLSAKDAVDDREEVPVMLMTDSKPWPDAMHEYPTGLQALPEEQELEPVAPATFTTHGDDVRVPPRRARNNSCPDRTNRNCVFFAPNPDHSPASVESFSIIDGLQLDSEPSFEPLGPPALPFDRAPKPPTTNTISSRPSSMAFSSFSGLSRRSSWRTSITSDTTASVCSSYPCDSCADLNLSQRRASPLSVYPSRDPVRSHAHKASVSTMNSIVSNSSVDAVLPRRMSTPLSGGTLRRSLSTSSCRSPSIISSILIPSEEIWYEQQEDLIDAYFYDPSIPDATSQDSLPKQLNRHTSTPDRFPKPFQDRPPGQFHLPWSPQESSTSFANTPPSSPVSVAGGDAVTVKVVLRDSIVLLRVAGSAPLKEVRQRIREKFLKQEGVPLSEAFLIGYVRPVSEEQTKAQRGRPRSHSVSSVGASNPASLCYVSSEEEWRDAIACAGRKLTIRLLDSQSQ
ncbi:hypothetical protein A0H81_15033 [Grifola frondosa]|uniref:PX domain-containing protein n=1 Tax=Grifola frondosa TaxID=5627 RepID=A0A1C7LLL3_GRIFR|nr:hypothetical protein A0H81_15033 [Grifola frondosa]